MNRHTNIDTSIWSIRRCKHILGGDVRKKEKIAIRTLTSIALLFQINIPHEKSSVLQTKLDSNK